MDSINKNQKEDNFKNLIGQEALDKIKSFSDKAGSCFFCTKIKTGEHFSTRPMAPEKIDEAGNFWFLSANDSHKNQELAQDPAAQLLFQGSHYSAFMTLYGKVEISTDRAKPTAIAPSAATIKGVSDIPPPPTPLDMVG